MVRLIPVLFIITITFTQENILKGDVSGVLGPGRYIITDDIIVPARKTLTLRRGTVLLFDGFYALTVKGGLVAEGTDRNKVVFTSLKDEKYGGMGPDAMDWNHIEITRSASHVSLVNAYIFYCTDGIISHKNDIRIKNALIARSGINRVSVLGKDISPARTGLFEYGRKASVPIPVAAVQKKKNRPCLKWIVSGSVAVGLAAISVIYLYDTDQ